MFSTGKNSVTFDEIKSKVSDADLVSAYLGVNEVPCIISSPLRKDAHPSFGLYSNDGKRIYWVDLATKDRGGIYDLLCQLWHCNYREVLERIQRDFNRFTSGATIKDYVPCAIQDIEANRSNSEMECKVREWRQYDIDYWASFGVPLEWLKYAEVYPISHKIIISNGRRYVFGADKLAYAFVEHKEGKVTLKIYQPYNKAGRKWANKHDRSVISLWSKIPERGDNLIISSSLKDSLNIWSNLDIPCICPQGEGYSFNPKVIEDLKSRYKNIIVFYDNDISGRNDSISLCSSYGLKEVFIPEEYNAKDPSDLYYKYGRGKYLSIMNSILQDVLWKNGK